MITDIFARRYQHGFGYPEIYSEWFGRLFMQVAQIFFEEVAPALELTDAFYKDVHDKLARELGRPVLVQEVLKTYRQRCGVYLINRFSDEFETSDWAKQRLSLVELLFRTAEAALQAMEARSAAPKKGLFGAAKYGAPTAPSQARQVLTQAIEELNTRLRESHAHLTYHNGMLQDEHDALTSDRTAKPFWEIVAKSEWAVVDREMKEACDRQDRRQSDAATYAMRALESTLKIICDGKGWSTGKEKGAINYIDNLRSERSGRFITGWEADAIATLFRDIRNPYSHGGGSAPPTPLTESQSIWALEACMSWIKSLVRRT